MMISKKIKTLVILGILVIPTLCLSATTMTKPYPPLVKCRESRKQQLDRNQAEAKQKREEEEKSKRQELSNKERKHYEERMNEQDERRHERKKELGMTNEEILTQPDCHNRRKKCDLPSHDPI